MYCPFAAATVHTSDSDLCAVFSVVHIVTGPPAHSVGGRLVTVTGLCRRLPASVTLAYATYLTRGQHATAGQSCYVPLVRHLVNVCTVCMCFRKLSGVSDISFLALV